MSVRLYIRKDITEFLHYKLTTIPPYKGLDCMDLNKGSLFKYDIDKFYWILDILTNPKQNALKIKKDDYFALCSPILIDNLGKEYKIYLSYLINNSFIKCNNRYKDYKCLRYKIDIDNSIEFINYTTTVLSIPNNKPNLNKTPINIDVKEVLKKRNNNKIIEVVYEEKSKLYRKKIKTYKLELGRNRKYPSFLKTMSQYFRRNLKINYNEAIEYCNNYINTETEKLELKLINDKIDKKEFYKQIKKLPNRYTQRITSVKNLHFGKKNKSLKFNRNSSNKRVDTNLTFMAKDIRKFIVGIENMSYLDLSNSQPVLFNIILKNHYKNVSNELKEEIKRYYLITISGNWYEELCDIFKLNRNCNEDREIAKKNWMKIAYSKNKGYRTLKNIFKRYYPKINEFIETMKSNDHSQFAIKLQKTESEIFINEICKNLVENKIIPYSIHDGVLVPKQHLDLTYSIMSNILNKHLGSVPVISIDDKKKHHPTNTEETIMNQFEKHFST
ncbi:hypothetical protein [Olleya sp. HaHaR_3_96]|uniref:hypothetical protein n=1 Tax=Olleya sp. HaHaR_3_96 TaxID=2745560 RepID=UPI001C4F83C0|nr:hypothetical protein [Olleya sp. HaHaR_3_96]QXP58432.1 hypothetical protein H0I26_10920 [Olleya sp. HaHaR_3_96]